MAILAGGMSAASIHEPFENIGDSNGVAAAEGGGGAMEGGATSGTYSGREEGAAPNASEESGTGGVGAPTAVAGAGETAPAGERRSAADGGDIWMEAPVVVKKYNKVRMWVVWWVKKRRDPGRKGGCGRSSIMALEFVACDIISEGGAVVCASDE